METRSVDFAVGCAQRFELTGASNALALLILSGRRVEQGLSGRTMGIPCNPVSKIEWREVIVFKT